MGEVELKSKEGSGTVEVRMGERRFIVSEGVEADWEGYADCVVSAREIEGAASGCNVVLTDEGSGRNVYPAGDRMVRIG